MQANGHYYDGRSSERHEVTLDLSADQLLIRGPGVAISCPLAELRISAPLGSIQRAIYLPDGAKCDFSDQSLARQMEQLMGKNNFFSRLHRWENNLKLALLALSLTMGLIWGFVQFGVPVLAEQAAYAIPPATENTLGEETLQILDRSLLVASKLGQDRRQQLELLFSEVVARLDATERPYRLELRSSPRIGANAFALPGGIVIMTDELVELAEQDEEIAAVLAHEVGHVRHRHAMRQVIQDSSVGLIVATLTGDVFSATSLAAALPTMLIDASFSRDMEREADDVALEYLRKQDYSTAHFAAILSRMQTAYNEKRGGPEAETDSDFLDYFSTHPAVKERIARLNSGQHR